MSYSYQKDENEGISLTWISIYLTYTKGNYCESKMCGICEKIVEDLMLSLLWGTVCIPPKVYAQL